MKNLETKYNQKDLTIYQIDNITIQINNLVQVTFEHSTLVL